jgi:uncharacterized protein YwqG
LRANEAVLVSLLEPTIGIKSRRTSLDQIPLGASRLGGIPDVPTDFQWPKYRGRALDLLAQIDLSDIAPFDVAERLPPRGWLYFFYDIEEQTWGFDPEDRGSGSVLWIDDDGRPLIRTLPVKSRLQGDVVAEPSAIEFDMHYSLPNADDERIESAGIRPPMAADSCSKWYDVYDQLREEVSRISGKPELYHHLLGHPQIVQNPMRVECQLVTNGLNCGSSTGYHDPRAAALRPGAADWMLLLQIDTDWEGPGWQWGDSGRLYFWIREAELRAKAFENVWVILQCG